MVSFGLHRFFYTTSRYSTDAENERLRLRRIVVAKRAEVIVACCLNCAEEKGTPQATCFQAKVAIGEIVGKAVERGID